VIFPTSYALAHLGQEGDNGTMHKTAIRRNRISAPVQWLINDGWVRKDESWLHFGEGYSFLDTAALNDAVPFDVWADDPAKRCPERLSWTYDCAYAGYVFNVVGLKTRQAILERLVSITTHAVYFAVRSDPIKGIPFEDGVLTGKGFQVSYSLRKFAADFPNAHVLHNGGHYLLGAA
jgi:hypothetical protein